MQFVGIQQRTVTSTNAAVAAGSRIDIDNPRLGLNPYADSKAPAANQICKVSSTVPEQHFHFRVEHGRGPDLARALLRLHLEISKGSGSAIATSLRASDRHPSKLVLALSTGFHRYHNVIKWFSSRIVWTEAHLNEGYAWNASSGSRLFMLMIRTTHVLSTCKQDS
jgi:hypothetical protein